MWGRLATCGPAPGGHPALGLPTSMQMPTRPSTGCPLGAGPQDTILPHKFCSIPNIGKSMRYWVVNLRPILIGLDGEKRASIPPHIA
jgi:hypothetical protein